MFLEDIRAPTHCYVTLSIHAPVMRLAVRFPIPDLLSDQKDLGPLASARTFFFIQFLNVSSTFLHIWWGTPANHYRFTLEYCTPVYTARAARG